MYSVVLVMALAGSAEAPESFFNCFGGGGCFGNSCFGGGWGGGCFGGGHFGGGRWGGCHGGGFHGGCYGGGYGGGYYGGCHGGGMGYYGQPGTPAQPMPEPVPNPKKDVGPAPATMLVNVPPDTKLTIEGYVSQQTATTRALTTPPIQPGAELTYTLVAETTINGQPASQTQRVTLRPGQVQRVNFNFSTADIVGP